MKLTVLNHLGDQVITDDPTTEGLERVKTMSAEEVQEEFDKMIAQGYTGICDDTKTIVKGKLKLNSKVTMVYPLIGG